MESYGILLEAFRSIYRAISNKDEFMELAKIELQKYRKGLFPTIPTEQFLQYVVEKVLDEKA